jgi:outer membrane protein
MNLTQMPLRLAAALACASVATAVHAVDLLETYQRALRADPAVHAAEAARLAGAEKAVQGDALLKPQLKLTAASTWLHDGASTNAPPPAADLVGSAGSGGVHQAALQLTQSLYDVKARADRLQLHQRSDLAEVAYRDEQQQLIQRSGEIYFAVLLAQQTLQVTQAEKAAVQMQLERAQARFDIGRGKITDVQEARARLDGVLAREVSATSQLALRRAQYEELTGGPADGLAPLRDDLLPQPPQPDSLQAWQLKGCDGNTRVQIKQHELQIARAEIDKHGLSGRPTLELVATLGYKGSSGGLSPLIAPDSSRSAAIGVRFSMPLDVGGGLSSRQREAVAKQTQAEQELAAAQRDARLQVQDAFLAVKTGVARIAALQQSLRSARAALEATALGRDLGSRTELDVLDAQQRVFSAQLDLAQARNEHLLGRIRLAAAAGELQEGDLVALNADLVP